MSFRRTTALIMLVSLLFVFILPSSKANAVVSIDVYLETENSPVNIGDILTVRVLVGRMPHITEFSNIKIQYDTVSMSYMSYSSCTDLPDTFSVSCENVNDSGVVTLNGKDEVVQDYLNEHKDDEDEFEDISFSSDGPVAIATLKFRVKTTSFDTLTFSINDDMTFINSNYETVDGNPASNFIVPVTSDVSSDSSLALIKIDGTQLADFKPDSFDYAYLVSKDTTEVNIEFEPGNSLSSVAVSDTKLTFGNNTINIVVTAQDGITMSQYKIVVTRPNSLATENIGFIDNKGNMFSFVNLPEEIELPSDFSPSTIVINGTEVPCYRTEGVSQVLLYVIDKDGQTGFRLYYPTDNKVVPYDTDKTIIKKSMIFTIESVPERTKIPEGFTPVRFKCNSKVYDGFVNEAGEIIAYLESENGTTGFYLYDSDTQTFTEYHAKKEGVDKVYMFLFHVCLGVAIFESIAIVVIVYVIRRFRKERVNPRPRRV
ncbi:MAG: cadherin-like beta sandwich domain-containing protein [Clostridiales bacterium]|nr:cadherin-like beta sandwich domain-containing protein [Clostridiales bacterium]